MRRLAKASGGDVTLPSCDYHMHICSENNFPTAAGLASSAAGYACLGQIQIQTRLFTLFSVSVQLMDCVDCIGFKLTCLSLQGREGAAVSCNTPTHIQTHTHTQIHTHTLTHSHTVNRQGSGSACRSVYGGFVKWEMGEKEDGSDSIAVQVLYYTFTLYTHT